MPDLITHSLFVYPAKKKWPKHILFLLIGSILPDLLGRILGVFISDSTLVNWFQLTIHTPFSLLLFTYSLSFFFPEKERKTIFTFLIAGVFAHFFLDLFQKTFVLGNLWFFPLSFKSFQIQLIWPDDTIVLIPVFLFINLIIIIFFNKK